VIHGVPTSATIQRVDNNGRPQAAAFFAVGWPGNADLVDAAAAGVVTERGYVLVDAFMATSVPRIFAAGDVDGNSMLVSSAALEGRVAAENAVRGRRRRVVYEIVPVGSFTDPGYGSVGLTEEQARARHDWALLNCGHKATLSRGS
jgi:pyruvate/2-oxoglutarate dehydrogenase complex dihydrolipoamide dehydrogenase (E3) component